MLILCNYLNIAIFINVDIFFFSIFFLIFKKYYNKYGKDEREKTDLPKNLDVCASTLLFGGWTAHYIGEQSRVWESRWWVNYKGGWYKMIDMKPLREIAKNDEKLKTIIMAEPSQMTEQEFLAKFSLLWNLSKQEVK